MTPVQPGSGEISADAANLFWMQYAAGSAALAAFIG
jgi:hypothetical protein